jgi:predicted permease
MNIFGRLRPGVTALGASEALKVIAPRVPTENPRTTILKAWAEPVRTLPSVMQNSLEQYIAMLLGVALLVLVIAAANAAGMLLARATARTREIATRMAVGAGRARLVRQLIVESVILCAAGGAVGTLIALWLSRFLSVYQWFSIPLPTTFGVNGTVLAIVGLIVLGTALVAGIVPALQATAVDLASALKASGAQSGAGRSRMRSTFVVAQIASSVVLLATAGLFIRSLQRSLDIDPGFRAEGVITASVSVGVHGYDRAAAEQFYHQLVTNLRGRPEIAAASMANAAPLSSATYTESVKRVGHPDDRFRSQWAVADSGFIELLETPLIAGRFFTGEDRRASAPVAIINLTLARKMWPNDPPPAILGRRILALDREVEVVGIIGNGKYSSLREPPTGFGYVPYEPRFGMSTLLYIRARSTTAVRDAGRDRGVGEARSQHRARPPQVAHAGRREVFAAAAAWRATHRGVRTRRCRARDDGSLCGPGVRRGAAHARVRRASRAWCASSGHHSGPYCAKGLLWWALVSWSGLRARLAPGAWFRDFSTTAEVSIRRRSWWFHFS